MKETKYEDKSINIQLWDIAGQERYGSMTRVFYKEAVGAIVVYDITRPRTFESAAIWKKDIDSKVFLPNEQPIPTILCANKADLVCSDGPSQKQIADFVTENNFSGFYETSAKTNQGIEEALGHLIKVIMVDGFLEKLQDPDEDATSPVKLTNDTPQKKGYTCCSTSKT